MQSSRDNSFGTYCRSFSGTAANPRYFFRVCDDIERQKMKRDLFWAGLLTRIAKQGAVSYVELKGLPIDEFFILVMEYEKSMQNG